MRKGGNSMNGLEKITARIEEDAQNEIRSETRVIDAEAEKVLADAEAKAKARLAAGRAELRAAADNRRERLISAAETEARQKTLQVKQECVDRAFSLAKERILSSDEDSLLELLSGFIVSAAETGREEVLLNAENRARFGEKLVALANRKKAGASFVLSEEPRDTDGVILRSGKVEYNGSISTRFDELRRQFAYEVAETLFS